MRIKNIKLENFRNYLTHSHSFDPQKNFTIFIGPNSKGKTNLLEAIYTLSLGKSFRTTHHEDLINWDSEHSRCKAEIELDEETTSLEVFFANHPRKIKNFKKNDITLRHTEFLGSLLTVLFHPEDLNMLYLSPSLRRRYLDILLSQTSRDYLQNLGNYQKVLRHRNSLLKQIRDAHFSNIPKEKFEEDLAVWNHKLISYGAPVIADRLKLIDFLKTHIQKIYNSISKQDDKVDLEYKSHMNKPSDKEIKDLYKDELFNRKTRDIFRAKTTTGPHLDDIAFFINGKKINSSASRGEFRTLLLAIKLAEIKYIKEKTGTSPILLLDDVFSELDPDRQKHFIKAIKDCQTIITATEASALPPSADLAIVEL